MAASFVDLDVGTTLAKPWAVSVLDWPEQATRADELARAGHLRLLLVAPDVAPPVDWDLTSDWLRRPADQRVCSRGSRRCSAAPRRPRARLRLDEDGLLWPRARLGCAAPLELRLAACLLENTHRVVGRSELDAAAWPDGSPGPRALDARLQRLRVRITVLGLEIVSVRQRGFLLSSVPRVR